MKHLFCFSSLLFLFHFSSGQRILEKNAGFFFIENKGQITDQDGNARNDVKYLFASPNFKLILRTNGWSYEWTEVKHYRSHVPSESESDPEFLIEDSASISSNREDIELLNGNPEATMIAEEQGEGTLNYYTGRHPLQGITGVRHYRRITYQNIYPGIDLQFVIHDATTQRIPEYSFILHPGADASIIQLQYNGNATLTTTGNRVRLNSPLGSLEESVTTCFSEGHEARIKSQLLRQDNVIAFQPDAYDPSRTFTIDPELTYATYFGSDSADFAEGMQLDSEGNIFVCGRTASTTNIATAGAFDQTYGGGNYDMFLLKFNAAFQLQWSTYYGGTKVDYVWTMDLDAQDNIYLGGESQSDGLATADADQKVPNGTQSDGVIAKFTPDGMLEWSRYFGGYFQDQVLALETDQTGRIIIAGHTFSHDSISTPGAYQMFYGGGGDIFLAALDTITGHTIWSTYYGANPSDRAHCLAIDAHNFIYMSGTTHSHDGIATAGTFHPFLADAFDACLVKFSPIGHPVWGTYIGGDLEDRGREIVLDHDGNIVMTGFSQSDTGIASPGSWKPVISQGIDSTGYKTLDAFVIKFDTNGQRLWGTYFGDTLSETSRGIAINSNNDIYIAGATFSAQGIVYGSDPLQTELGGVSDAYFAKFNSNGNLIYSSYYGGSNEEQVGGYGFVIQVDDANNIFLCSSTLSTDSIATPYAYQTMLAGNNDVFIAKIADTLIADAVPAVQTDAMKLLVYPDPLRDHFTVRFAAPEGGMANFQIMSMEGRCMQQQQHMLHAGENTLQFSIENCVPGTYLLIITAQKMKSTALLIVQ